MDDDRGRDALALAEAVLALATRDERALETYRALDVHVELVR